MMCSLHLSLSLVLFSSLIVLSQAGHGCVWIVGKVQCEKDHTKSTNVEIRVLDRDSVFPFSFIDPDDLMGVTFSNEEGRFSLDGCADDFDWLPGVPNVPEPYIKIRHYCNKEQGETIELPEFNVFTPNTYDLGTIILDTQKSVAPPSRDKKTNI
ncbi:ttr-53 [Pristionchus pacificus]|uniref:Uncharacterized protein n=1 Tax=Pristionchus pacificus TaxID=54126 RepID=A0A8R1Z6A1_PRIPA|nr:ttr-53 [Pristionchus pacificus]